MTARSLLLPCSSGLCATLQCSRHPGDPHNPAFWIYVSTNLLSIKNIVTQVAVILNRIFHSTLSRDIGQNWLRREANSSIGIYTPSALAQTS